jgi:hypothetical protein
VATISLNTPDAIEFKNLLATARVKEDTPTVLAQVGEWEIGTAVETGVIIDVYGPTDRPPILTAVDARKLAKWLTRAADSIDAAQSQPKTKKRQYYEEDDETGGYRFKS